MQDIEKANQILKEMLDKLQTRIDVLLPLALCTEIQTILNPSEEPSNFQIVLKSTLEQVTNMDPKNNQNNTQITGKSQEFFYRLLDFYKDFVNMIDEGIVKKSSIFMNSIRKKLNEQRKKPNGDITTEINETIHTFKNISANFPSPENIKILANLVHSDHKLQLGLILLVSLLFALFLRSSTLIQKNPPYNFKESIQLLDAESLLNTANSSGNSSVTQDLLRICFVDILTPLIETTVQGIRSVFAFDLILEYYIYIAFLLDHFNNSVIYSTLARKCLKSAPISSVLRVLVTSYMKSPFEPQKKAYTEHFTTFLLEKPTAFPALLDTVLTTKWPMERVKKAIGKMIVSVPASNSTYYIHLVIHMFKAIYIFKPTSIKNKMGRPKTKKGKAINDSQIALFWLGKILEAQPELGKKIIVRKFLLKFYDLGLIDLTTLRRECVISNTGNKFRNMDKKSVNIRALSKDIKHFIRFLKMMDRYPSSFFECMNECSHAIYDMYSQVDKNVHNGFNSDLKELLTIYFSSDQIDPYEIYIPNTIICYMTHEITEYIAHIKAYYFYVMKKKLFMAEPDTEGMGNSTINKPSTKGTKLSLAAIVKYIKSIAEKRKNSTDKRENSEKEHHEETKNLQITSAESCLPYSLQYQTVSPESEVVFNKINTKTVIEGGHLSLTSLNKSIENTNELLNLLIQAKESQKSQRILKSVFLEVLNSLAKLYSNINTPSIDLLTLEEYSVGLQKAYLAGIPECTQKIAEEISESINQSMEFGKAIYLSVIEKLCEHACEDYKEDPSILAAVENFISKSCSNVSLLKIGLIILTKIVAEINIKKLFSEEKFIIIQRVAKIRNLLIEIKENKDTNEEIQNLIKEILEKAEISPEDYENSKQKILQKEHNIENWEICDIKKFIDIYKGLISTNSIIKRLCNRIIELSKIHIKNEEKDIIVSILIDLYEINPGFILRTVLTKSQENEEDYNLALFETILFLMKSNAFENLTSYESHEFFFWILDSYTESTYPIFLDIAKAICRYSPIKLQNLETICKKLINLATLDIEEEAYLLMIYQIFKANLQTIKIEIGHGITENLELIRNETKNSLVKLYSSMIETEIINKVLFKKAH